MFTTVAMIGQWRRFLCLGLLVASLTLSGCFGHFPLTNAVYSGNRNVYSSVEGDRTQRKMAQSAVMWVFIPVYAGAALGDMVVFNFIEFWTGSRTDVASNSAPGRMDVTFTPSPDEGQAALMIGRNGKFNGGQHRAMVGAPTPPGS